MHLKSQLGQLIWPRSVISIDDLAPEHHSAIFGIADRMAAAPEEFHAVLDGMEVALLFLQPSTRTSLSFQVAVHRLGGKAVYNSEMSLSKGESLADTVRVVSSFADLLVLRHPEKNTEEIEQHSDIPVINAGDGSGEHPTQGLLDLYMIRRKLGTLEGLKVGVGFDPLHSRTEQTFLNALSMYHNNEAVIVAPPECQLTATQIGDLRDRGLVVKQSSSMEDLLECDVAYVNRFQTENLSPELLKNVPNFRSIYRLKAEDVQRSSIQLILDPLPRVGEIESKVDEMPQAGYFEQAKYGVPLRMAVLLIVGKNSEVSRLLCK